MEERGSEVEMERRDCGGRSVKVGQKLWHERGDQCFREMIRQL